MSIQSRPWRLLGALLISSMASTQQTVSTLTTSFQASGDIAVTAEGDILVADFGVALNNSNGTQAFPVTPDGQLLVFVSGIAGA